MAVSSSNSSTATSLREVRAGGDKKPISGFVLGDGFVARTLRYMQVQRPPPL
jgi:hypothetical protein